MNVIYNLAQSVGDLLDRLLDRLTTYRLVLYILIAYALAAIGLSFMHKVAFTPRQIIISTLWIILVSRVVNRVLARTFKVPANHESDLVTGLILALILTPLAANSDYVTLAAASSAAMISKYVITYRGRHIFNPAAFGAFISIIGFHAYASWWIGTKPMFPLLVVGGLLILRKMKRFSMVAVFLYIYAILMVVNSLPGHAVSSLSTGVLATSLLFFATVMLTEPLTSPTTFNKSLGYAAVVALLYSVNRFHFSPEEALLVGNLLTFVMSPNRSLVLNFVRQTKEAEGICSYVFKPTAKMPFRAGQYMEWTLPGVSVDSRGNRRYLTISSAPSEENVMFTVKMPAPSSGFKTALAKLQPGDKILAAQLAGDFVLPKSPAKVAFVAGGVGITPFRSMVKSLVDNRQSSDASLLYFAASQNEFAFKPLFDEAKNVGLTAHYLVGHANADSIVRNVPDYAERIFYISGPQGFVAAIRHTLTSLGVNHSKIVTDFFPGYN